MKRAGNLLRTAVGHDEVLRTAAAHRVLREWPSIVGDGLAARSHPDRYGKGTVWVAVQGSAWAQELRMRKEIILERLRERGGDACLFTDVRFGVRPFPPPAEIESSVVQTDVLPRETDLSIREIADRRLAKMRREPLP